MNRFYLLMFCLFVFSCSQDSSETRPLSDNNTVTSFKVFRGNTEFNVTINGNNINVIAPYTAISTNDLRLEVTLPEGASISPNPSIITSLTNSVTFTITAENGDERKYRVTLEQEQSPENSILSFVLKKENEVVDLGIDEENGVISELLSSDWNLNNITAEVSISNLSTIAPDPTTITDYTNPITYVVTAENGETKSYEVTLTRELSTENDILSFTILKDPLNLNADINSQNGLITQKVPPSTDLTQLSIDYNISDNAIISPDPKEISDYSNPVNFTVTSEDLREKNYNVVFEVMDEAVNFNCDVANASKWFGGDNRADKIDPDLFFPPRNVGTGQSFTPDSDIFLETYSIRFSGYFQFVDDDGIFRNYFGNTTVRLQLRDTDGNILASKDRVFSNPMTLFWITFDLADLNLVIKKDTLYYFTWYLVGGEELGIYAGTYGNKETYSGLCGGQGLSGTSKIREESHLDDWHVWSEHPWHFNFRLSGMK